MDGEIILYLQNPDGDNYPINIFDGYDVKLNLSFTDLESFKPTGTYSDTFRCPLDKTLREFLGAVDDVNFVGWFNPKVKIPAFVTADTVPYSEGHVEMTDVIMNATGSEVELRYYGETPDIKTALGENKLKDLSNLATDLNHTLDYDAVTNDALLSGNVLYYLIDKGQNFSEGGEVGTQPIFSPEPEMCLYPSDLTPAVNARWVWDEVWSDAGFVVDSPSNFPDTLNDLRIPWYNGTETPISTDAPNAQNYRLNLLTADEFTIATAGTTFYDFSTELTESYDNGNNVLNNVFTAPYTGVFRFRAWVTAQRSGGTAALGTLMVRDGNDVILAQSQPISISTGQTNYIVYLDQFLSSGDEVKLTFRVTNSGGAQTNILGSAGYDPVNGTGIEMYEVVQQIADYTVSMPLNAPDMTQYDFLTSIAGMFNLIIVPDRATPKKVRVESMNDYLQSGSTYDWTNKLDTSKSWSVKPTTSLQARELMFTYREDGDALNKIYKDEGDRIFGTLDSEDSQLLINLRSDFASGTKKVELKFAPTPCNNIPGTNIPIPKFINDQGGLFKAKPRILYHAFSVDNVQIYDDDTATVTDTTVRVLSHFDNYDLDNDEPGSATLDLNFAQEVYLQQTAGSPYQNLFYLYWQDYIRELYDPTSRLMTAHFALTINDFLNFDFSNVYWIKDSYWRVLDIIDFAVGKNVPTKVRLLKILELDVDCEWTPFTTNVNGTITFQNADGVTTGAGTEECCNIFGYTWVGSACYWNTPQGQFRPNTNGLNNFGAGSGNAAPLPNDSIAYVSNSNIQAGNFGAKYGGNNIESGRNNLGSIMHGDSLKASNDLGQFAAFGKNAEVQHEGIHFGAGIVDGEDTSQGRAQFGSIGFFGEGTLVNNGDKFEIFLMGNDRLVIRDDSVWACKMIVAFSHFNVATGQIDIWGQQVYYFELHKANSIAGITTTQIAPDHEDGNMTAHLELEFDVTTDTTQHRMNIEAVSSTSLPSSDLLVTAKLEYAQVYADGAT